MVPARDERHEEEGPGVSHRSVRDACANFPHVFEGSEDGAGLGRSGGFLFLRLKTLQLGGPQAVIGKRD